jgi:hypothetical protein
VLSTLRYFRDEYLELLQTEGGGYDGESSHPLAAQPVSPQ